MFKDFFAPKVTKKEFNEMLKATGIEKEPDPWGLIMFTTPPKYNDLKSQLDKALEDIRCLEEYLHVEKRVVAQRTFYENPKKGKKSLER